MKSIKKITVFYTDGTFEDIEKVNAVPGIMRAQDVNPIVNPTWWGGMPPVSTSVTPKPETTTYQYSSPQPIGSAQLTTVGIQALTSAQIASFSITNSTYSDKSQW